VDNAGVSVCAVPLRGKQQARNVGRADDLADGPPHPVWFLRFIGVCEIAGALGLILPSVSRIRTGLTPLAACGLIVIMIGATTLTAAIGEVAGATFPLVVGIAAAFVAYGRTHLVPITR
jgi:hypothetical protein